METGENTRSSITKGLLTLRVTTHDMHTCGEPVRIIQSGMPALIGQSVLEKRNYAKKHLDHYRKLLMNEPRGHKDMYGAILTKVKNSDNEFEAIFLHNEGYSSMCGHAVIALGRYVVDDGLIKASLPVTEVVFHCPCGPVKTTVDANSVVRFESVPAFLYREGVQVNVPKLGQITVDIAFGGAFYVILNDERLLLSSLSNVIDVAGAVTNAVKEQVSIKHPEHDELSFLYGTIVTDGKDDYVDGPSTNICVFADKQVDRSPTGSGVTARIALQVKKGLIALNQEKEFKSLIGTKMTGKAIRKTTFGQFEAVVVEVSGTAYHTGDHIFYLQENDPLTEGFQLPR